MFFILGVGLSRRLIEARDAEHAIEVYLSDVPMRRIYSGVRDELRIRPALEFEIAEFKRKRIGAGEGQLELGLDDVRKKGTAKQTKEHA